MCYCISDAECRDCCAHGCLYRQQKWQKTLSIKEHLKPDCLIMQTYGLSHSNTQKKTKLDLRTYWMPSHTDTDEAKNNIAQNGWKNGMFEVTKKLMSWQRQQQNYIVYQNQKLLKSSKYIKYKTNTTCISSSCLTFFHKEQTTK